MTIQEILRQHQISDDLNCECGYNYDQHNPNEETFEVIYTAHQAEVLDKHMQEREAEAWELGASTAWQRSSPTVNGTNYYWRSKGEPVNPHSKETFDGR